MKIYKYCDTSHLENLKNNELYLGKMGFLNDKYEGVFKIAVSESIKPQFYKFLTGAYPKDGVLQNVINSQLVDIVRDAYLSDVGICSFSEYNNSLKMWGHYADKLKGICLEFDTDKSIFKDAKPVKYLEDIFTIELNTIKDFNADFFRNVGTELVYYKYKIWEEEKEWRIFGPAAIPQKYEPDALTAIYFGFQTKNEDIRKVFENTKYINGLKYYAQILKRDKYEMDLMPGTEDMLVND